MTKTMKYALALVILMFNAAGTLFAACTATENNSDNAPLSSSNTSSLAATISAPGDLVAIAAWCYSSCSGLSVTLGSQTAVQTSVPGNPGPGTPGTGQGFIFYILSTTASGSQTLNFTATGGSPSQTQIAYIDFTPSAGCAFKHNVDSPVGSGTGGTVNTPSITPSTGDLLFNFTWVNEHVTAVNSPWTCTPYDGSGETGDCSFNQTRNADAFVLSAASGSTANNMTNIHSTDSWEGLISSFSMSSGSPAPVAPTAPAASTHYVCAVAGSPCNASDSNAGTSKTAAWLHAPGMTNCTANCASYNPVAGDQIIFRGGDTWHFGNSSAVPYVGAADSNGAKWDVGFSGTAGNCDPSDTAGATRTSCIYLGVDTTWFSGASWTRPVMSGDNTTSTSPVTGCTYPTNYSFFSTDNGGEYLIIDNLEWTGMCQPSGGGQVAYMNEASGATAWNIYSNNYTHGWTHVPFNCGQTCFNMFAWNVRIATQSTIGPGNVCDGWDSDPTGQGCDIFGGYLIYDNVFGNMAQIVLNGCHDSHDNLIYNFYNTGDGVAHGNAWECNSDAPEQDNAGKMQPNVPFNVYYNNVHKHDAPGNATGGDVKLWICPNPSAAEYMFNNIMYDMGTGNTWNLESSCSAAGSKAYKFNNTVDLISSNMDCPSGVLTSVGNHFIVDDGGNGYGNCSGTNDIIMTHAQAAAQGYMASGKGVTGNNSDVTCANDATPCAPTLGTNSTVGGGVNEQSFCTAMLSSTQSMIQNAGLACKNATTDACTYSTSNHTVSCPGRTPVVRPSTTAWERGAYQFSGSSIVINPPTGLIATVH